MKESDFTVVDLADIREELGDHFDRRREGEYKSVCTICGEDVDQSMKECAICEAPVTWRNSKRWKNLYGNPAAYIRELLTVDPETVSGRKVCELARVTGFANQREADRWKRADKRLGQARMLDIIHYASKRSHGRGLLAHCLNIAEKAIREGSYAKKQAPKPVHHAEDQDIEVRI